MLRCFTEAGTRQTLFLWKRKCHRVKSVFTHFTPKRGTLTLGRRVPALPVVTVAMGGGGGVLVETNNQQHQQEQQQQQQQHLQLQNNTAATNNNSTKCGSQQQQQQQQLAAAKRSSKDFIFGKIIGEGSFSTVYLTRDIHTNKEYAIKVCEKRHILREKKTQYVKRERDVLNKLSSEGVPFFVKLYCTFQDHDRLYFVLTYAKNGELLGHINKVGAFDTRCSRFYAAEILVALEHLHRNNIIHRDLKPENILLDENMHILITDFGSAKDLTPSPKAVTTGGSGGEAVVATENDDEDDAAMKRRRNSFVGTAQYVSPELLTDKTALPSSDLWALGCIIYQMVSGLPPFRSRSEYAIFQKIIKLEYEFPDGFCPKAKDLVQKLLVLNPKERLGSSDMGGKYLSVRGHGFFSGADWNWEELHKATPPAIHSYLATAPLPPSSGGHDWSSVVGGEPGLDDRQLTRLMGLELQEAVAWKSSPASSTSSSTRSRNIIADLTQAQIDQRLLHQAATSKWHSIVNGNLILKQGLIDKRKGLFARRRMFLLTTGPHLYYVDPVAMVLKGEIPWSPELRAEAKNFKIFFVHTPNRTYYLEDPEGYALEWCRVIEEVKAHTYTNNATTNSQQNLTISSSSS